VAVTGASMGIGEAIAKVFADHGANVVLLSRDTTRVEAARVRVGNTERTLALSCDVRNREEIDRALGLLLHHFGRLDVWINNAGYGLRDSVAAMELSKCRDMFETNLFGTIAAMQAVIPVMRNRASVPFSRSVIVRCFEDHRHAHWQRPWGSGDPCAPRHTTSSLLAPDRQGLPLPCTARRRDYGL